MSYMESEDLHHGPPGPLDVAPTLGDTAGLATNYRHGSCPCTAVGATEMTEGNPLKAVVIAAAIVGGLFLLLGKTKRRR